MAAFNKFQITVQDLGDGSFNLNADGLYIMLTNTSPNTADTVYNHAAGQIQSTSNAAEIAAGNGYSSGGTQIGSTAFSQTAGLATLTGNNVVFTASGGSIGPFRYCVLYDGSSGTATTRPLLGWWDYGSSVTLTASNTFTINLSGGILTLQ